LKLFFREVHGAENGLIAVALRFFGFLWRTRFFGPRAWFALLAAGRLLAARRAEGLLLPPRRLDATERAAQFVNLALVGELLALGDLDEFKHLVKVVNHLLERLGDLGGVLDGLADGRGLGGPEIGGLDPRLGALRFRAALGTALALKLARGHGGAGRFGFRRGRSRGNFRRRFFGGGQRRIFDRRGKFGGFLGMRLAEAAGCVGFVFHGFGMDGGFFRRFGRG
jgi:hypothetical protein